MANIIATNADRNIALADNDRLYVPRDVAVIASSGQAIASDGSSANVNNHSVAVDGTVIGFATNAITLDQDSFDTGSHTLWVGSTGVVRTMNSLNSALYVLGSSSIVQNWGEISGRWSAWYEDFDNGVVQNHGVMTGEYAYEGVYFTSAANYVLINTGLITGGGGVQNNISVGRIWNSGEIIATNPGREALDLDSSTGDLFVNNSGLLSSSGTSVRLDTDDDTFINSGQVIGGILMFNGDDYWALR